MMNWLRKYPLYLWLLPLFFVLHGWQENFGFISFRDVAVLAFTYLAMSTGIASFSYLFFRKWNKAGLITLAWLCFFFFFAAIHEFLRQHSWSFWLSRYSILLSVFTGSLVLFFIYLFKSRKPFARFNFFVNLLMLVYILVDLGNLGWKAAFPHYEKLSVYRFARESRHMVCDTCSKPDIYFLLFDEYGSSLSLNQRWGYHNELDSFLLQKGFSVQAHSRSNYNFTPFSMSATFNMSYIRGIADVKSVTADDYANCNILIRDNQLIGLLDANGYDIVNYSMFDLAGNPATVEQSFLPLKTKLITDRTLFARMNKDIGWLLNTKFPFSLFQRNYFFVHRDNNLQFLREVQQASTLHPARPRFIYAHFYMPHPPFFYDQDGKLRDKTTVYDEYITNSNPPPSYLGYVTYTNSQIRKLVDAIQHNNPKAVIIILGDHGFRYPTSQPFPWPFFQNMNAVYFPDHDYSALYDSISNVNMFRVITNKYLNQRFPLLKDSSIFLVDKH